MAQKIIRYTTARTNSDNLDFQNLVSKLDRHLALKNGKDNDFFTQYNKIDKIRNVVVVYDLAGSAVGCGAMKEYSDDIMEIKRMFVLVDKRGKGIASQILSELQDWAQELGYKKCILETGDKMIEAIAFLTAYEYHSLGKSSFSKQILFSMFAYCP